MPRILHLVKDPTNRAALPALAEQAQDPENALTVVLLHEARGLAALLPGIVFRLEHGDAPGNADSSYPAIDHSRLLDLIFAADTVVAW